MNAPKILTAAAGLLITTFLACSNEGTPLPGEGSATTPLIPKAGAAEHYVSPLAQLMRDMTTFADSTKQHLLRGDELLPYPATFKDMLTAEPTPGMVDHRTYDPFAFSYLRQLDSLYKVVPEQRQQAFDELIQYCTACHGQVCPGPLVRIKKLRMPAVTDQTHQ